MFVLSGNVHFPGKSGRIGPAKAADRELQWATSSDGVNRKQRKRQARAQSEGKLIFLAGFVLALPVVCLISLGIRVASRVTGWTENPHGPDRNSLPLRDLELGAC